MSRPDPDYVTPFPERFPDVWVDYRIRFGAPCLRGVTVAIIAARFRAGESVALLANDYGMTLPDIEQALRYEFWRLTKGRAKHRAAVQEAEAKG